MHIPDGFLDPKVSGGLLGAAAAVLAYCVARVLQAVTAVVPQQVLATAGNAVGHLKLQGRRVLTALGAEKVRRMGAVAAWVFAAQMFNFPIASGTSGHLLGGVFACVLLGPFAGAAVIAAVLIIQAFFFADGGIMALGANIINLAAVGSLAGYGLYAGFKRFLPENLSITAAAWFSVVLAALACSLEIGVSGTIGWREVTAAMLKVHALIGLAEAMITVLLVALFKRSNPA
jgi:cobalt/nickel transport system permease protein